MRDVGIGWTLNDYLVVNKYTPSRCCFHLEGFESETMIAECLLNEVVPSHHGLDGFVFDLCLLIAMYRGAPGRWYREITLCKYGKKQGVGVDADVSLESKLHLVDAACMNNAGRWVALTTSSDLVDGPWVTHFYASEAIAMRAFGAEDVLIKYANNNGLICRNLESPKDVFGDIFRANQNRNNL